MEPPVPGPLNFSIASRSSSSSPNNFAPIDFTSFTTDYQPQTWLPSPPQPQPLASNQNNNSNSVHEDFVLYPSPHPQPRARVPVKATHRPSALQPFLAQNNPRRHSFSLQLQRHLQQQYSSPDPRVTQLARSPSYWSHPTLKHSRQHTASVPSTSPNTNPNRPPIPLFNGQQNHLNTQPTRRVMSTPNFTMEAGLFDLNADMSTTGFPASMDSPLAFGALDEAGLVPTGPPGTISPRDLMMDTSVPPSGTFTDLSTPSFESPGTFSQNASPMFEERDVLTSDNWPSLFEGVPDLTAFDMANFDNLDNLDVAAALHQEPKKPDLKVQTAPRLPLKRPASMASSPAPATAGTKRPASSMASSPVPATGGTKHSTISGVNARARKSLSPVDFDPNDPVAAKRARNTEAARKSRAKKMERQADSERRIEELNDIIAARDAEIANLKAQLQIQNSYQ
ncbi:unnamed protein product [Penicillium olsonii]|uniref:BZIP domain-containing protein n=1 Tax=Penicillium olsonii TaxID=99116 RepID=A0A9W4HX70_PENOL|nr:unnamed protein product [Penicillium olsonii]